MGLSDINSVQEDNLRQSYAAKAVPRYTSYPTANHFHNRIDSKNVADWLKAVPAHKPVSLYIHIPFCDRLCWFCGCHTKQTNKYEPVREYMRVLLQEIELVASHLPNGLEIAQLHLGGGSPSLLQVPEFSDLRAQLEKHFLITQATEISVEIDPQDLNDETVKGLELFGLMRASLGVQDFDKRVQEAINRPQSFNETRLACEQMRQIGARSVNVDALYGLPFQTTETIKKTIQQVISLKPDRIALFGYAHVPWLKKHQTMITDDWLPSTEERIKQADHAEEMLLQAGYIKIGLDHFAKPYDTLALAQKMGALHRNFQGYTSDRCRTLIGFGASAISYLEQGYTQNTVATGQYMAMVENGQLPASRGVRLGKDDHIRRHIIERLMCDFAVDFEALEKTFGSASRLYLQEAKNIASEELPDLCFMQENRLVVIDEHKNLVRIVAAGFDRYFKEKAQKHSLAV